MEKVNKDRLSVLFVGNSYSDDTIAHSYDVAKSAGIKCVEIADLYYGGCTIDEHLHFMKTGEEAYLFRHLGDNSRDENIDVYDTKKVNMDFGLSYTDWDVIILQQGSRDSGIVKAYNGIDELIDYVKTHAKNKNVRIAFNMTWAYAKQSKNINFPRYDCNQEKMYQGILNAVQEKIVPNKNFSAIIPNGTAVQNARTSFIGEKITRDLEGDHMTLDFGRYLTALTFVKTIAGINFADVSYAPKGLSEKQIRIAKESAENAIKQPFKVTQSKI